MKEHAKASINVKAVKSNSEHHNNRESELGYVYTELTVNNDKYIEQTVNEAEKECREYCKEVSGRKMMANATPIREAVVNLNAHHTQEDVLKLADDLKEKFGIDCFQVHIHRDEGKAKDDLNYHAHLLFKWQDRRKEIKGEKNPQHGKVLRFGRGVMSQMQTVVAESLNMERGQRKTNQMPDRLEPIEYKRQQEQKLLESTLERLYEVQQEGAELTHDNRILQEQNDSLEQKKNRAKARAELLRKEFNSIGEFNPAEEERLERAEREFQATEGRDKILELLNFGKFEEKHLRRFTTEEISGAIEQLQKSISWTTIELEREATRQREFEEDYHEFKRK